jgi:UDP-2-acetamido-2,6-beta-L-arabino-hexul-4-ose reductase
MIHIGITGSSGFIGSHLRFYLHEYQDIYDVILIKTADFSNHKKLADKLKRCDIIIHLAGLNLGKEKEIYDTNVGLTKTILSTLDEISKKPKIIFLSSIHNKKKTAYGLSKRDSERMILKWGVKNKTATTSIVVPHIFGEFVRPYYNSAIATLCYELAENKDSTINPKAKVNLLYVRNICSSIVDLFGKKSTKRTLIQNGREMRLTDVYSLLKRFRDEYFSHIIPLLKDRFELHLFNTFRSYLYPHHFPISLNLKTDDRGSFVELVKNRVGGQTSFSTTYANKNIIRGNHYHTRKIERFSVISGEAIIKMRKLFSDKVFEYKVSGQKPVYIDIPTYYTHSIENIGPDELLTIFWTNEIYDPNDPDTFCEPVIISNN